RCWADVPTTTGRRLLEGWMQKGQTLELLCGDKPLAETEQPDLLVTGSWWHIEQQLVGVGCRDTLGGLLDTRQRLRSGRRTENGARLLGLRRLDLGCADRHDGASVE